MILPDGNTIVRERQLAIRREMDRRGLSLKAIAMDSGLPYSSVVSYFPGERDREPATMPCSALFKLCGVLPADLISLLLPVGFAIVRVPEAIDHDELADAMVDYLATKQAAHRPDSECGPAIGPTEGSTLTTLAVIAGGKAQAA